MECGILRERSRLGSVGACGADRFQTDVHKQCTDRVVVHRPLGRGLRGNRGEDSTQEPPVKDLLEIPVLRCAGVLGLGFLFNRV